MKLKNLNPWNWFKHEENLDHSHIHSASVPVKRDRATSSSLSRMSDQNPLADFHREVDRMFDRAFEQFGFPSLRNDFFSHRPAFDSFSGLYVPNIDVSCTDSSYQIKLDVPGLAEDIEVELSGDVLTIKGQKKEEKETDDKQFYRMERRSGMFQRTLAVPDDAIGEETTASLKDGVLSLEIPRHEPVKKDVKKITIGH